MGFFKQLFCNHDYECVRSYIKKVRPSDNALVVSRYDVVQYKCRKCGKIKAVITPS